MRTKPIPPGEYVGVIEKVEWGTTKVTGRGYVKLCIRLNEGRVWHYIAIQKILDSLKRQFRIKKDSSLEGKIVNVILKVQEYGGINYNFVSQVRRA